MEPRLTGWNFLVYTLIRKNFMNSEFSLSDLYKYEEYFGMVYPSNYHIKDKLRQTLQNLRNKNLLSFIEKGKYKLLYLSKVQEVNEDNKQQLVYLLSNESIPGWVKIGRTNSMDRRLKELYNTSVPLPFVVEETIETKTTEDSKLLEKSIHNIIDTLNPSLRKITETYRREFFKMTINEGKSIFLLVNKIVGIAPTTNNMTTI